MTDNAPIHTLAKLRDLIVNRHYKSCTFYPIRPFCIPIKKFCSKIKAGIRKNPLTANDRPSDRVCESAQKLT